MQSLLQTIFEMTSPALVGIAVAYPLLMLNHKLAPKLGLIDWPKARGIAEVQIPIIGPALVLVSLTYFVFNIGPMGFSKWFIIAATVFAVMGILDDRSPLPPLDKMFIQIFFVSSVVICDPNLRTTITSQYGPVGTFLSIFFILGMMNAINFIDGIDGLCGLVLLFGATGFILLSSETEGLKLQAQYCALLIGTLLPFLFLNVIKRKGFIGNVGSYFFSFVLAYLHLIPEIPASNAISRLSVSGLCFLIPLADAGMILMSRILTRRSPFQADKGHLHHRLIQTTLPLRYVLITFAIIDMAGLLTGFAIFKAHITARSFLPVIVLFCYVAVVGYMIVFIEKATKKRVQSFLDHLDQGQTLFVLKYKILTEQKKLPSYILNRVAARINSEIRVSDVCYVEEPNIIIVALKGVKEPLTGISARLEAVFRTERLRAELEVERAEFLKVSPKLDGRGGQRTSYLRQVK